MGNSWREEVFKHLPLISRWAERGSLPPVKASNKADLINNNFNPTNKRVCKSRFEFQTLTLHISYLLYHAGLRGS